MKQRDFTPCVVCRKGVAHSGAPYFYRVRIELHGDADRRDVMRE